MTLPNFLIIGAPKAGTTTLTDVLASHPEIFMCPIKEVGFFWAYEQNVRLHGPGSEKLRNRVVTSIDKYKSLFQGVTTEKAIGESSVRYLVSPQSPSLIKRFIPNAKLIISLRQPAERAFSAFCHNIRDGHEVCDSFEEAIAQEFRGERDGWLFLRYLSKGLYYQSLKRYLDFFSMEQFHISLFEDLKDYPVELFRSIFDFLEVDDSFGPDLSRKKNVSGTIRNPVMRFVWTKFNRLKPGLSTIISPKIRKFVFEWVTQDMDKMVLSGEIKAELTAYYREDILKLQDLIQRDLSHWLDILEA